MRQLVVGIILAVCLVGCGEKAKFSVSEKYSLETYANNSIFTKVISDFPDKEAVVYKFTGTPSSVFDGIKTNDLDILGGYVGVSTEASKKEAVLLLTIKGKASFDKLVDRLNQGDYLKDMRCMKIGMEKGAQITCNNFDIRKLISFSYDPFTDNATFFINYF